MSNNLPTAPAAYDKTDQDNVRRIIQSEIAKAFTKDGTVEIGAGRLILKDTVTGTRYNVTIVSGTVTLTSTTL